MYLAGTQFLNALNFSNCRCEVHIRIFLNQPISLT